MRIHPILITPALLKELGFECREHPFAYLWNKGAFHIGHNNPTFTTWWLGEAPDIRFESLHELENLYYMIYGVELIKK